MYKFSKYMLTKSFYTSNAAKRRGRTQYYSMVQKYREGELVQVRRGIYAMPDQLADIMIDVDAIAPGGVVCRWTAWNIYSLTTTIPQAYHVAVKRGRKIVSPDYPSIEFYFITESIFDLGITTMNVGGYSIRIYDIERCVCDAIKFRNKIGTDVCSEVLTAYLARADRDISKLMKYAHILRISNILQHYLSVKL